MGVRRAGSADQAMQWNDRRPTLHARFATKPELFTAVVKDQVARWSAHAGRFDHVLPPTQQERPEHHAVMFLEAQCDVLRRIDNLFLRIANDIE